MAPWNVPDDLDARVRQHVGDGDVAEYVQQVITGQLDFEDNPATQAEVDDQMKESMADIEAGRVMEAREAMRMIAKEKGIQFDR